MEINEFDYHLIKAEVWSKALREMFVDELFSMKYVNLLQEPVAQVSLPVAVAMGAAAVIIKNPTVSRRFWQR